MLIIVTFESTTLANNGNPADKSCGVSAAIMVIQSFVHFHLIMDSDYVQLVIDDILSNPSWQSNPNVPNFDWNRNCTGNSRPWSLSHRKMSFRVVKSHAESQRAEDPEGLYSQLGNEVTDAAAQTAWDMIYLSFSN